MSKNSILTKDLFDKRLIFIALCTASIVLWILTIANTSFYYFPPDPLFFFLSLPLMYWLGIGILITLIVTGLYRNQEFLTIILIFLYIHGISAFVFEMPRHVDVYLHASGSESILLYGTTNPPQIYDYQLYSNEFPATFIFMAILKLVTGANTFLLLKIVQFIGFFIMIMLIYFITRSINKTYAFFGVITFMALYIFTTHFSPELFSFIYYAFIVYSLITIVTEKLKNSRTILVLLILALVIFPMVNPTADYFMIIVLSIVSLVSFLIHKRVITYRTYNKILSISLLSIILIIGWLGNNEDIAILQPYRLAQKMFETSEVSVFPTNPTPNHIIYNFVQYAVMFPAPLITFTILIIIVILLKYGYIHIYKSTINLFILLSVLLVSPLLLTGIVFGIGDKAFINRTYTFVLLILPAILVLSDKIGLATTRYKRLLLACNKSIIILALLALVLIPISKYGNETFSYVPYSSLYAANMLVSNEKDNVNVVVTNRDTLQLIYYYGSIYDKPTSVTQITLSGYAGRTNLTYGYSQVSTKVDEWLKFNYIDGYATISRHESNGFISRYHAYDYVYYISNNLTRNENLVIDAYSLRIYKNFD